ncbi:hypothetical protein DPMN_100235 [Dreissena polymorpha]|uniref:Uncharacterized protein n=1 Tax=Dreissena polymorpha TaxID=45954 RepID=A0A9D4R796_DREPO|nr:hypothetical protein DPMN_100235 [Dreissena polymorpha]
MVLLKEPDYPPTFFLRRWLQHLPEISPLQLMISEPTRKQRPQTSKTGYQPALKA